MRYRLLFINGNLYVLLLLSVMLIIVCAVKTATADEVKILSADFQRGMDGLWQVNVTLQHGDTGWDHYADHWRVVDGQGNVLANRVLYHPHVNEQPFTRSQGGVKIPVGMESVYIEARDKVHGWTEKRLKVDLRELAD
jgi:hypothetical protein